MTTSIRVPLMACLNCGKPLDSVSCLGPEVPTPDPGDITACINCGHLMVFDDSLHLRNPDDAELNAIADNADGIREVMAFIKAYQEFIKKERQ